MTPQEILQLGFPVALIVTVIGLCAKYVFPFIANWMREFNDNIKIGLSDLRHSMDKRDERWEVVVKTMHDDHNSTMAKMHADHQATLAHAIVEIRSDRQEDRKVRHDTNSNFQAALLKVHDMVEATVEKAVLPLVESKKP